MKLNMMMRKRRSVNGGQSQITHILCLLSGASLTQSPLTTNHIISNLLFDDEDDDDDDDDDDDYHNDVPKRVPKRTEACFYFTISFVCPNHYVIVFGVQ